MDSPLVSSTTDATTLEKPFVITLHKRDKTAAGHFRPEAHLHLTEVLRTSGLLLALPAEDLKNLLFMLTFLSPNGECLPTVQQLAQAMHISPLKVRARMMRLVKFRWHDEPLVVEVKRGGGLDAYSIHPKLVVYVHGEPTGGQPTSQTLPHPPAGRAAIIAHSREHYARPRAEVEAMINQQMDWTPAPPASDLGPQEPTGAATAESPPGTGAPSTPDSPQESAREQVRRRLWNLGMSLEQADYLLKHYELRCIQRQLRWLPYRKVRNPAGFLVAAIEDNYSAPLALWHHRASPEAPPRQGSPPQGATEHEPTGEATVHGDLQVEVTAAPLDHNFGSSQTRV
ncbi:MAG: hypothetical protein JO316_08425 [Abitibacteriaceae bacterium]|nr:hypothetical protein [Abditibacteriaceae bacterium]